MIAPFIGWAFTSEKMPRKLRRLFWRFAPGPVPPLQPPPIPMVSSWRWCSWLPSSIVLWLMSHANRKLGAKGKRPWLPGSLSNKLRVFETVLFCLERPDIVRYKSQVEAALENCVHCFDISQHGVTAKLSNPLVQALLTFYIKQNLFKWEIQNTNQFFPFPFWSSSVKYFFANLVRGKGGTPKIQLFCGPHGIPRKLVR